MSDPARAPIRIARTEFPADDQPRCRAITPRPQGGWSEPVLSEWELRAESWTDQHPHTEYTFVIEGHVFIESGGVTVEARAGDVVCVPAGAVGRYWAPAYARLLAIYGPSDGGPGGAVDYRKLDDGAP